ncbi:hypothetical protein [Janthinobacterium fluminis]|uniref:Uncharacterized protein n=1 Tax=Janthinobacterium fluminis TaxID=2987524 RepID=A0ABT5KA08_9BURK|nr:hypothetical protein [Janthinobacterium fluminis]MDC8760662.1 hypothetical protein [Janthinobacterium fluminis]
MADDNAAARKARAESLRRKVRELVGGVAATPGQAEVRRQPGGETPAEFVHRKMHELDRKK